MKNKLTYVVVTPVKDEAKHITKTLQSVVNQSRTPLKWVIVDDGSTDETAAIVRHFASQYSFIQLVSTNRNTPRATGVAEIIAFNLGLNHVAPLAPDCIVKLDGDLSFNPDYFDALLGEFESHPKLGIASGVYLEQRSTNWEEIVMPYYHAFGASKVVRSECFNAIGGFVAERGWDTVDVVRARALGWETWHLPKLKVQHWKPEGKAMGRLRTAYMHGEIFYRTARWPHLFLLKFLRRLPNSPLFLDAMAMLLGYLQTMLKRSKSLLSPVEQRCYRALLFSRFGSRKNL
jgi:glycosyltransferase involved in cell wall biosynthesis